ncbi:Complement C1q tumor necrosis factor-related protein 1 [Mactra antiquata]
MASTGIQLFTSILTLCSLAWAAPVDQNVAFSVGLTNTQRVSNNDIIVYDRVFINDHYGYDELTGEFRCPVEGTYIFHFHAYNTNQESIMWLDLMHNNQPVVSVSGYNSHTVGSQSVILKLRVGDKIHIQSKEQQTFALFGLPDQIYSTFTGHIISASSSNPFQDSGIIG